MTVPQFVAGKYTSTHHDRRCEQARTEIVELGMNGAGLVHRDLHPTRDSAPVQPKIDARLARAEDELVSAYDIVRIALWYSWQPAA